MTIEEIIELAKNRLKNLSINRELAFSRGDIDTVNTIDIEILTTNDTLSQLLTLVG